MCVRNPTRNTITFLLFTFFIALIITLFVTGRAHASPITAGSWHPTPVPNLELHKSEDDCEIGPHMCAGIWFLPPGTEELSDPFGYSDFPGYVILGGITDYQDAPGLSWDGLTFYYDNGHGFVSSSQDGVSMRLYRYAWTLGTIYFMHVEDKNRPIVPDWNDRRYSWYQAYPIVEVPPVDNPPNRRDGQPVPEPQSIFMFGIGLFGFAMFIRKRRLV